MKFIATKNNHKQTEKHPDFRIYMKDDQDNMIEEEYQKKDGTTGKGWKAFGAIWHNVEGGKIKSSTIDIDFDAVQSQSGTQSHNSPNNAVQSENESLETMSAENVPF